MGVGGANTPDRVSSLFSFAVQRFVVLLLTGIDSSAGTPRASTGRSALRYGGAGCSWRLPPSRCLASSRPAPVSKSCESAVLVVASSCLLCDRYTAAHGFITPTSTQGALRGKSAKKFQKYASTQEVLPRPITLYEYEYSYECPMMSTAAAQHHTSSYSNRIIVCCYDCSVI